MESSYDKPKPTAQEGLALRVTSGRDEGKVFPLVEGFVGKQASCDVRLTDPALSGMHARISLRRNVWFITDLTSAPDIRVNNNVVKSRKIQYGDTIVICNTTLQVVNAPAGLEKPRKIETKRSPAVKTGAPPSQTMEISLDHKVEGWTHNKPTPKKKKASDKHAATSRTRKESEPALNTDELEKYRSKSFQQDDVAEKSGVRMMVWILILVAIVAPLLVGGLHLSNKRREKHELSMTYAATQEFERQNPANYEAIIDEYRKLEMTATGSDNRIALMARENIDRIQLEAKANEPALKTALVPLDQNAEAFAAGGSFAKAADVYENYAGKMKTQVLAARADEISKLKALASKQAPEPPKVDTAAKPVAPTPPSKTLLAAKALDAKLKTIVASAVDSAIKGDIALAIAELGKITADPALAVNYKLAEQAILSLTLLETVDRTVKASTVNGVASIDPAENKEYPLIIRLVYSLRKGDLLAAQFLAQKLDASLLSSELTTRSRMSDEDLKMEQAVMGEFATAWSTLTKSATRVIPRPDECIEALAAFAASKPAKEASDFCLSMTRLQGKQAASKFIARYGPFFDACRDTYSLLTGTGSQLAGTGNAKIIDADANAFFFESAEPIPDPTQGRIGLFAERDVFFDPDTNIPVAARIEVLSVLNYKKISDQQGAFEIPLDFKQDKPVKGDRIFVGPDIKLGTQLIPLMVKEEAAVIYASNFSGTQAPDWKSNSGRVYTERGDLRLDTSPSDDNGPPAGAPNVWFEANLPDQPATIEILLLKEDDSEFAVILDKLQFVLSGSKERPAGTWFDGHMIEAHKLPILPAGTPLPLKISWTPLSTTVTIGTSTMTASVDATRRSKGLATIGFITRGKSTIKELTITRAAAKTGPRVLGINESGTTAIISRGSSAGWSSLQPGHGVFLLNKTAPPAKLETAPPVWESMQATVVDVGAEFIICAIGKNGGSIGSSTIASLTKTLRSTEEADSPDTPHYMTASGWYPEAIYATIGNDSKGEPFLIPDLPCAYAPRGFASEVSDTITHPYTLEPFVAFPTRTQAADFSERAGTLRFPALPTLTSKEGERCRILLTALAPTENAIIPLTPPSFPILPLTAARSPQGWNVVGDWKDKFGRLMSPLKGGELPVAASQAFLWENCQYSVDVKIESPSTDEKLAELVVEVYSPFWKKGLALITGTHGSTISFDSIRNKGEAYSLKQSSFAPSPGLTRNGQFSIMKTEKVITGQLSKTVLLRRIAVGSVTDMTSRIARGATSAPSEPIQDGMKVMAGLQPETLTMTSERLSSVDDGL